MLMTDIIRAAVAQGLNEDEVYETLQGGARATENLRDGFAKAALQGALARPNSHPGNHDKTAEGYAVFAYECAAAMLKERMA